MGNTLTNPLAPLDPLPLPQSQQIEPRPARPPTEVQPGAGFAGPTGQIANIASNFLTGWLAGKDLQEQKKQQAARAQVAQSYQMYQNLQGMASDPSIPKEQRDRAAGMLGTAWTNYVSTISKYASPGEEAGKKKGLGEKIKGGLKKHLGAPTPELTTESMVQMLQNLTPVASQARGPTPEQELASARVKETQLALGNMQKVNDLTDQLNKALQNPNRSEEENKHAQDIALQINALKGQIRPEDIPSEKQREFKEAQQKAELSIMQIKSQVADLGLSALKKVQSGQQLTDQEKRAYDTFFPPGQPPSAVEIYSNMKGKQVTDPISGRSYTMPTDPDAANLEALKLATRLEAKQKAMAGELSFEMQNATIKDAIRAKLKMAMGHEPTQDEVKVAWFDAVYGVAGRSSAKGPTGKEPEEATVQGVFDSVNQLHGGQFHKFFSKYYKPNEIDKDGKAKPGVKADMRFLPRENFSLEEQKEWDRAAQAIAAELQNRGYSSDQIVMIVGQEAVQRALHMEPPPKASPSGARKIRIIARGPNGEVQESVGTDENIEAIKKEAANNHWTIETKPIE